MENLHNEERHYLYISERFSDEQIKNDEVVHACRTNEKERIFVRGFDEDPEGRNFSLTLYTLSADRFI